MKNVTYTRLIIGVPGKIVRQESSWSNAALFLFLPFSETFNAMLYRCSVLTSSEYPKFPGDFHMKEMGCWIKLLKETNLGVAQGFCNTIFYPRSVWTADTVWRRFFYVFTYNPKRDLEG